MKITKAEKRIVSLVTSVLLFASTVFPTMSVYAAEQKQDTVVTEGTEMSGQITTAGDVLVYEFTPDETTGYLFASNASGDTYGSILDQNQNELYTDNDGGEDLGFQIRADLTAGVTYTLQVSYFADDQTGDINWNIAKDTSAAEVSDTPIQEQTADTQEAAATEATETAEAETVEVQSADSYEYEVLTDNTVKITQYTGSETTVTIPSDIDGKKVTVIGERAFVNNTTMQGLTIPNTVTKTEYMSIANCGNLKSVTFAEGSKLQELGKSTFSRNFALSTIQLPDSLTTMGAYAFSSCYNLTSINLGNGVKTISEYAFSGDRILKSIEIPNSVTQLGKGVFMNCMELESVSIGTGLEVIPDSTFYYCSALKNISIPSNITAIGIAAFSYTGLTEITLPDSVTSLGNLAFNNCKDLKKATIGNKITYIGEYAFLGCGLTNVTIGTGVLSINQGAFSGNISLTAIDIPDNVTELQYSAFRDCTNLSAITIPDSVTKIGGHCLDQTKWLDNQKAGVVYAGKVAYTYKGTMPEDAEIEVKDGTLGIADYAFENDSAMKSVSIADGVKVIGKYAFYNCTSLDSVYIPGSVTEIGDKALGYYRELNSTVSIAKDGFKILGSKGSAAETYATENGFTFEVCAPLKSMELNRTSAKLLSGDTATLKIILNPVDTTDETTAVWTSSDDSVVSVDQNGKITADQIGTATITATIGEKSANCVINVVEKVFDDVNAGAWYEEPVAYVNANGLMTGLNASTFGADQNLARAQFATILYRMEGSPAVAYTNQFPDVPDGVFFTSPVLWAYSSGVVGGYQNGLFGPGDNINREQMAVMMYRYAKYKGYDISASNDLSSFPDRANVDGFAEAAMKWAVGAGLITGDGGNLNPYGTANRAVCATIIMRFMKNCK